MQPYWLPCTGRTHHVPANMTNRQFRLACRLQDPFPVTDRMLGVIAGAYRARCERIARKLGYYPAGVTEAAAACVLSVYRPAMRHPEIVRAIQPHAQRDGENPVLRHAGANENRRDGRGWGGHRPDPLRPKHRATVHRRCASYDRLASRRRKSAGGCADDPRNPVASGN